jgi:hypothetical protein
VYIHLVLQLDGTYNPPQPPLSSDTLTSRLTMASKTEHEDAVAENLPSAEGSYAVQPIDPRSPNPVDGPATEAPASSPQSTSSACKPDFNASSDSEPPTLDSPFHSPKSSPEDGMSDTTLEDGEIQDDLLDKSSATKTVMLGLTTATSGSLSLASVHPNFEDKHGMYS